MTVEITGQEQIQDVLQNIAPRHARNLMRSTNLAVARIIVKLAKDRVRQNTRTLKKAIKAKREKSHPDRPKSGVYVTHGNDAKHDAFYWRFVEYGTAGEYGHDARPFIGPSADEVRMRYDEILAEEFGKKLENLLRRNSGL